MDYSLLIKVESLPLKLRKCKSRHVLRAYKLRDMDDTDLNFILVDNKDITFNVN